MPTFDFLQQLAIDRETGQLWDAVADRMIGGGLSAAQLVALTNFTYGSQFILGTGVAAADLFALQDAANLLTTRGGGTIYAIGLINLSSGPLVLNSPIAIIGGGSSDGYAATSTIANVNGTNPPVYANESEVAATTFFSTSATLDMVQVNAHGCRIHTAHFSNRSAGLPSAGAAVRVGGPSGTPANGFYFVDCSTNRTFIGVDINNSVAYTIRGNKIIGYVKYGVKVNNLENYDEGDSSITGNWIMSGKNSVAPDAGIRWESGGGVRISNNKISRKGATAAADLARNKKGIVLAPISGVISGVIIITGNSIEAIDEDCIFIDTTVGSGSVSNINISSNEFNCSPGLTNYVLRVNSGASLPTLIYFGANTVNGCFTMVRSALAQGLRIGPNVIEGGLLGGPLIDLANAVNVGYNLNEQHINNRPANCTLLLDATGTNYNSSSPRSGTARRIVREAPSMAGGAVSPISVDLFRLDIGSGGSNNSCEVEFVFAGFLSGPGAHRSRVRRVFSGNGAGTGIITIPAGWTDQHLSPNATTPNQAYLTWSFTQSGGVVTTTLTTANGLGTPALSSAFGGIISGEISMNIDGTVRTVVVA